MYVVYECMYVCIIVYHDHYLLYDTCSVLCIIITMSVCLCVALCLSGGPVLDSDGAGEQLDPPAGGAAQGRGRGAGVHGRGHSRDSQGGIHGESRILLWGE